MNHKAIKYINNIRSSASPRIERTVERLINLKTNDKVNQDLFEQLVECWADLPTVSRWREISLALRASEEMQRCECCERLFETRKPADWFTGCYYCPHCSEMSADYERVEVEGYQHVTGRGRYA